MRRPQQAAHGSIAAITAGTAQQGQRAGEVPGVGAQPHPARCPGRRRKAGQRAAQQGRTGGARVVGPVAQVGGQHGELASRLAARGCRVTGLDSSAVFLDRARAGAAAAGVSVEYVAGGMRQIPWTGRFDRVVSWSTAFGYFDDTANRTTVPATCRSDRQHESARIAAVMVGKLTVGMAT